MDGDRTNSEQQAGELGHLLEELLVPYVLQLPKDRMTITVPQFAKLVHISRSLAYEAAARGEIPVKRIGHRFIIPIPLLINWLAHPQEAIHNM